MFNLLHYVLKKAASGDERFNPAYLSKRLFQKEDDSVRKGVKRFEGYSGNYEAKPWDFEWERKNLGLSDKFKMYDFEDLGNTDKFYHLLNEVFSDTKNVWGNTEGIRGIGDLDVSDAAYIVPTPTDEYPRDTRIYGGRDLVDAGLGEESNWLKDMAIHTWKTNPADSISRQELRDIRKPNLADNIKRKAKWKFWEK